MTDQPETAEQKRRRWISIGETVAILGLIISALALWNSWKSDDKDTAPVATADAPRAVPLALHATVADEGKALEISPVEAGHALEGVTLTADKPASGTAEFGSSPVLSAAMIESWLPKNASPDANGQVGLVAESRYIEAGVAKTVRQHYRVAYRWTDGGLFRGKSVRLTGLRRG